MMLWVSVVGIRLANALVLGSEPRMPPEEESLESPEALESPPGLVTVSASCWVSCCMSTSSKPSASW